MKEKIFEVAKNHTENEETAMQLTNELCVLLGVSGLFPSKSGVESIVEQSYKNTYGTNYDENSLKSAKDGAMIITNWLMNNR